MDHGLSIEREVRDDLLRLAKQLQIPLLATNDSHYVTADQADAHDNLLCIGVGKNKDDPNRFRFHGTGYYIKTADEMRELFRELPEACDNTLLIAERVEQLQRGVRLTSTGCRSSTCPEGEDQESWLRKEVDARPGDALRRPDPGRGDGALRDRDEGHRSDGLLQLLPDRRRHLQIRARQRHPGRSRPWLGDRLDRRVRDPHHRTRSAGARPAVRAVPQPGAHQPARRRPRLRRPSARPDGPLRHRQVRRRVHRAGQHVRHDQGEGRGQGLQPDPGLPVRDGRPDHEGDAAGRDGQGRAALRAARREPRPLRRRAARSGRSTTATRTSARSSTPAAASRV